MNVLMLISLTAILSLLIGSGAPRVTLGYGAAGGVSDLLDRVESLTSTGGPQGAELGHVATYRYDGISRLGGVDLGDVPGQSSQTYVHTDDRQFDLFGRVVDRQVMSFDVGSGQHQQIMHSQFGYDLRGDRLYERLTQLDHPTLGSRDNTRSSFFDYDALGRLAGEHYGTLLSDNSGLDVAVSGRRAQLYALDSLNRRVGTGSAPGIEVLLDGVADSQWTHVLDARGGLTGLDDGTTVEPVDQDIAGAITELHGRTIYHDWLGRPILALDADTGDPIFAVDYDGFGRVAQRRAPWPDNNPTLTKQRIETYFYDGVRRIQEVFADPIAAIPPWPVEVPVGGLGGYVGDLVRTEAEYIWSAASGQPFDTCHVQIDWWDREAWFVQDHQTGTVRAYTDANGEMVRQYRFDAFGNLLNLDTFPLASGSGLFANFRNRIGHQGLFAERVDASTTATTLSPNPNAQIWYQSRSRWYVPELGRFMTSDPNATGVPTMTALAMLGTTPTGPPSGSFSAGDYYADGWDTWTAYGANPVMGQDPNGMFILGFFGGASALMEVSSAYNDEVLDNGMSAYGNSSNSFQNYANWQMAMVELALDMSPQGVSAFSMLATAPMAVRFNAHHVIPKFLYGLDGKSNLMDLPEAQHRRLHQLINKEFKDRDLPSPNARGRDNWRNRLLDDLVPPEQIDRAKDALRASAQQFDVEFPDYPGKKFNLVDKMDRRLLEYGDELSDTLKRARRVRRR